MILLALIVSLFLHALYTFSKMSEMVAAVAEISSRDVVYKSRKIIQKTVIPLLPITLEMLPMYIIFIVLTYKENRAYYKDFTTYDLWVQIRALSNRILIATLVLYSTLLIVSIVLTVLRVEELKLGLRFTGFFYTFTVLTIAYMHSISQARKAEKKKAKLILLAMLLMGVGLYVYAKGYLNFR